MIPDEILGAPMPSEDEFLRALVVRAVRARGVLTEYGVVEHNRLRGGTARIRPHVDALVADGALQRLEVADGGAPVLVATGPQPAGSGATAAVLLSPFDNLLWDRPFAARVLGFEHLIEVYKPPPQRRYGYYVLPFLLRRPHRRPRRTCAATGAQACCACVAHHPEPRCDGEPATRPASSARWTGWRRPSGSSRCSAPTWAARAVSLVAPPS